MNLDKLFSWIAGVVIACAAVGQFDALQNWVMRAQAKVIYELTDFVDRSRPIS